MAYRSLALAAGAAATALAGCSSKPRNFAPVLTAAPTDAQAYEAQWLACRQQVAATAKTGSGRAASAVGGVAAGAGTAAVGAASAGASTAMVGAMAAAAATLVVAPIALIGGAWGVSKIKKNKKERAIKTATADCLAKAGYSVDKWRVMKKSEVRALPVAPAKADAVAAQPVTANVDTEASASTAAEPR